MTKQEKNKYRLMAKIGAPITKKEADKNRCGNCEVVNCVYKKEDMISLRIRETNEMMMYFCLSIEEEIK
jgi:hypothetical protein